MEYPVGRIAQLAGVTVRTLHHYDEIGLLRPSGRTSGGYRRYEDRDLERLRQILVYRELGFPLEEIATVLDDPDQAVHLQRQHALLLERMDRLRDMVAAIELLLEAEKMGINLTPEEKIEVFGSFDPDQYEEEVQERWGGTDAYQESARRTARYTKADWQRIQDEVAQQMAGWLAAFDGGVPATDEQAMRLAEEHRAQISAHFYECTYEIQVGLAEMYLADPRFTKFYDDQRPGLAQYVHDAIQANAIDKIA